MNSRFGGLPLDILQKELRYIENTRDMETFCQDPYIYEKICKDENGYIWRELWKRDLSEEIQLDEGYSVYSQYMKDKNQIENFLIDEDYEDLLLFAAEHGYEKIIDNLNLNDFNEQIFYSALKNASDWGNLLALKSLFKRKINLRAGLNFLLLLSPIGGGYLPIVQYLVEQGADIHFHSERPLSMAIYYGHYNIAKYLMEQCADINIMMRDVNDHDIPSINNFLNWYKHQNVEIPVRCQSLNPRKQWGCRKRPDGSTYCCSMSANGQIYCKLDMPR